MKEILHILQTQKNYKQNLFFSNVFVLVNYFLY
jgi:hypothetical protein